MKASETLKLFGDCYQAVRKQSPKYMHDRLYREAVLSICRVVHDVGSTPEEAKNAVIQKWSLHNFNPTF